MRADAAELVRCIDFFIQEKLALLLPDFQVDQISHIADEIYGGCIYHRFRTVCESRGALANTLEGITGYVRTYTSSMLFYTSKGKD